MMNPGNDGRRPANTSNASDRSRLGFLAAALLVARSAVREIGRVRRPDDDPEAAGVRAECLADERRAARQLAPLLDPGTVYLARDPWTGEPLALRRLSFRRVSVCPAEVLPPIDFLGSLEPRGDDR